MTPTPPDYRNLENFHAEIISPEDAVKMAESINLSDQNLSSWKDLEFGLEQSLDYLRFRTSETPLLSLPGPDGAQVDVTLNDLRSSLRRMLEVLPQLDANPGILGREFQWIKLSPDFGFTGYYEPTLRANYTQDPVYRYPLYSLPPEVQTGVRYFSRQQIDRDRVLSGRGMEIAWVDDDVDIFFLQVQGSGRLVYPDGKVKHVLYAGKNNHPYVSLGRIMRDQGLLEPDKISMPAIRDYLAKNPQKKPELLDGNPSYVFFRLADEGPLGSINRVLTPRVSMAVDPKTLPHGSVVFLRVNFPNEIGVHDRQVSSIGLAQDSGGAIKGRRVDLFSGSGEYAEHLAGHLNSEGHIYILLPNKEKAAEATGEADGGPAGQGVGSGPGQPRAELNR